MAKPTAPRIACEPSGLVSSSTTTTTTGQYPDPATAHCKWRPGPGGRTVGTSTETWKRGGGRRPLPRPGLKKTGFLVLRAWRGVLKSTTLDNTNAIAEAICRRAYPPKKVRNRLPAPRRFARGAFVHFGTTSPCEIGRSLRFDPLWVGGWLTAEARPFRLTVPLLSTSSHAFLRAACATIRRLCDPRPVFAPSDLPDLDPAPSAQEYPALRRLSNEPSFFQTPLKSHRAPPIPFPRALVESVPFRSRQPPCPLRQRPRGAPVSLPASAAQGGGAARSPRASLGFARSSGRALSPDPLPLPTLAPRLHRLAISPPTGFMLQPRDGLSRRIEPADDG